MADDTYRKFHSGRFGPQDTINPDFNMRDGGKTPGNGQGMTKKKKTEEDPEIKKMKEDDEFMKGSEGGESTSWFSGSGG